MAQWFKEVHPIWSDPAHGLPRIWSGSVTPASMLLCVGYMLGAALLGSVLFVRPLLLGARARMSAVLLTAGFVPGYLMLSPCNRFVSMLVPNRLAAWVELGLLAGFCAWRGVVAARLALFRKPGADIRPRSWGKALASLWPVPALLLTLVWGICHVTGDATGFTFVSIYGDPQRFPGPFAKLPLFGQHYDEICFLHPVLFSGLFSPDSDLLTPYWLMTGFARVSVLTLAYFCTRRLGLRGSEAAAVAAFLFLSSMSINPGADWEFVDSSHPLVFTAHPARLVGALAPLIFAVVYLRARRFGGRWPAPSSLIVAFVLGAGLVSVSLHVFATILLMAGLSLLLLDLRDAPEASPRPVWSWLAPCLLAFLPVAYAKTFWSGWNHVYFASAVAALAIGFGYRSRSVSKFKNCLVGLQFRMRIGICASVLAGSGFGLLVLGNILAPKTGIHRFFGLDLLVRGVPAGSFAPGMINTSLPVPPGANVLWSASSPSHFIAALGLPLLLAALAFLLHAVIKPVNRRQRLGVSLVECMLLGLLCGIAVFHFMGGGVEFWLSLWVRSRFTEGWFYGLAASSLCVLFAVVGPLGRRILSCAVLLWAVFPWSGLAGNVLVRQLAYNWRWILDETMK